MKPSARPLGVLLDADIKKREIKFLVQQVIQDCSCFRYTETYIGWRTCWTVRGNFCW